LPSVDEILKELKQFSHLPHELLVSEIRSVIAERRHAILHHQPHDAAPLRVLVEHRLGKLLLPSLRPVINATGVILHTNLGRAPLADFRPIRGYSNLEYDLKAGKRGKRDMHTAMLLERLIGRASILVNNNAAAVYLVLRELAAGFEVIVSRGELIEIGDGFRIPDIMAQSGAVLKEVGTTNKTQIEDYRRAISDRTRLILRVHPSNFHISGFTSRPSLDELSALGRETGIPVYEDLGSGCLVDLQAHGIAEPLVKHSFAAGVNIATFSCDKLLGGPQSGIIAGDAELVQRVRRNPMYRALRCDKLAIEALSATLIKLISADWDAVPTLRMIFEPYDEIERRARQLAPRLAPLPVEVRPGRSAVGGGSTPDQTLPTFLLAISVKDANVFEQRLRRAPTPVIARIERNQIVIDLRTVGLHEEEDLVAALQWAALTA
jgi:L-seryl-tRNA(Ser) seleniumtransferase